MIKSELIKNLLVDRIKDYYGVGPVQRAAVEEFANLLYNDIITIVAAQALSHESALDVFTNLTRIYEGKNLRPLTEQMPLKYDDGTYQDF